MSSRPNRSGSANGTIRTRQASGSVSLYDAVGQDASEDEYFVRHIGLSLDSCEFDAGDTLSVRFIDMAPPLTDPMQSSARPVDLVGSIQLTATEIRQIQVFIDELVNEYTSNSTGQLGQYTIHPHFTERSSEHASRRYSCVGFLVEAYLDAGIELVDLDELPDADLELLTIAYRDCERLLQNERAREKFGLTGDGPWPVLLPGYVFHAMNRTPDECRRIPYVAQRGDQSFSSQ